MRFFSLKKKAKPQGEPDRIIGNWIISFNPPYGFVIKNRVHRENYHFYEGSNGWITGEWAVGREVKDAQVNGFNSMGMKQPAQVLVDKAHTKNLERTEELKAKKNLTPDEKDELLLTSGLRTK